MGDLLAMTLDESQQIQLYDGPAEQWAGIPAEVLLACGASGPHYYAQSNEALARALPRARAMRIPHSGHDAVNRARRRLIEPFAAFFAAPVTA